MLFGGRSSHAVKASPAAAVRPVPGGGAGPRRDIRRRVGIVGLGYVGLPTALGMAEAGADVVGYDVSAARIAAIRAGTADLLPGDHDRLRRHLDGSLLLTGDPAALATADAVLICVPTPIDGHQVPDLRALRAACARAVDCVAPGQLLVLTSTTYVGSTRDLLVKPLTERGLEVGRHVFVAFSPERIDPGNPAGVPERVPRVVGGATPACAERAAAVLETLAARVRRVSSPEAAEMTKLVENTFRAVNIALANEFADLGRDLGVEITEVIDAAATKPYGFMAFTPGPGVGGHCIPCDPHYLLWQLRERRTTAPVVTTAMDAITTRPRRVARRAWEVLADAGRRLDGSRVIVVGVSYKPGVADARESPALSIIAELRAAGAETHYTDPLIASIDVGGTTLTSRKNAGDEHWDLVLVHTAHPGLDTAWIADHPLVLDATYRLRSVPHRATV